jgi:predicted porin
MLNKILRLTTALVILPNFVFAEQSGDTSIKIGGTLDSQYGVVNQEAPFRKKRNSNGEYIGELKKSSLANSASIKINVDKKSDTGVGYGAYIKLNTNTSKSPSGSSNIANEVKLYLKGNLGKLEIGSTPPVGKAMEVNSYSIARATGGLDGDWSDWIKNGVFNTSEPSKTLPENTFLTAPQLPIGFDEGTKANKVNYFTPKINNFSFGFSFSPDSKAKGTSYQTTQVLKDVDGYKNIFQPAARYETVFKNNVRFTTAVLGEFAEAKDHINEKNERIERNNLKAWQLGAMVERNGVALSGAYGDIGKSGTKKYITKDESDQYKYGGKYWSIGSAYSTDKYGISIGYMKSKRAGYIAENSTDPKFTTGNDVDYNRFELLSVGADYKVMPGFMPYVEVTRFKYKPNNNFNNFNAGQQSAITKGDFNKGTVILAGTKIEF